MNHIYIHCPLLPEEDYRFVLERLCPEDVKNITVYTRFPVRTTPKDVEALVNAQKAYSQERTIRFQNYAIFSKAPRFGKGLRKALRKHSFSVEIRAEKQDAPKLVKTAKVLEKAAISYKFRLDESQDQMGAYKQFSACGLHTYFVDPQYTAESPDLFDKWLYDPAAQGVNTFCDIINMLVMESHSPNCRHASCFGNTFFVDEQLDVYLCPNHPDERTKLGSLKTAENLEGLLESETVSKLLPAAVGKRQNCAENCAAFCYCQGGCPLETQTGTDCAWYSATVARIRQRLLEVYREKKVGQVNYVVKNAILNALAFGTAFFK